MAKFKLYFDMDGTLADLYSVENWHEELANESTAPYEQAEPMHNFSALARRLNHLHKAYEVETSIISWNSRSGSDEYHARVEKAKKEWLKKHLPSVQFEDIFILPYGTPKASVIDESTAKLLQLILFDDDMQVGKDWNESGVNCLHCKPEEIFRVLETMKKEW